MGSALASPATAEGPRLGPYVLDTTTQGDCLELIPALPDDSIDVVVTSPPYWGQRTSLGTGVEADPRRYVEALRAVFAALYPKLKAGGALWINMGDAYNTPVNWRFDDRAYSSLGPDKAGLAQTNSAYVKPRAKRRAYIDQGTSWLRYGNMLALPYRLTLALTDDVGYLFRGEIIWRKRNPMPEGRCRRPHRQHEGIYLFAKSEQHDFRVEPPVGSVWEFGNEKITGIPHFSRFPTELPSRCIAACGPASEAVVLDPFSGSGTTGIAALAQGCRYIGFEIDPAQVEASNVRLSSARPVLALQTR